jgi:hypothetical protein
VNLKILGGGSRMFKRQKEKKESYRSLFHDRSMVNIERYKRWQIKLQSEL